MPSNLVKGAFPPIAGFSARKAAQAVNFFARQSGGQIEKLKLFKLIYLSDRNHMAKKGRPIFYDEFYSLKDGPVCSSIMNGVNQASDSAVWDEYVAKNGNIVVSLKDTDDSHLDEFSRSELEALRAVWDQFGEMTASKVRNYTHLHCPEYREIKSGRIQISYEEVLRALNWPDIPGALLEVDEYRMAFVS
jgi:uncharacterized phage-associated protein